MSKDPKNDSLRTLAETGERAAIARLTRLLPSSPDTLVGPGDDCAVVRPGGETDDLLLTSDPVIEGVHFDAASGPERVGHKAVGRILSDIAAMAGTPRWALLDIVAPPHTPIARLEAILRGAAATGARYGFVIAGGDMAGGPVLEVHAFGVGTVPAGQAVLRSGARPGDALYVTGRLGGSRAGRHLDFAPRVHEGEWLRDWARAMIDVSDGLASDARHLADQSNVAIRLDLAAVPVSQAAARDRDTASAREHALTDGEDFELLFTVPGESAAGFERAWAERFTLACTRVGDVIADGADVSCRHPDGRIAPLPDGGFNHFKADGT